MTTEVTKDDTAFIKGLYRDVLKRDAEPEGLAFWEQYEPKENLVNAFMAAAEKEIGVISGPNVSNA